MAVACRNFARLKEYSGPTTEVGSKSPGLRLDLGESVIYIVLYRLDLTVIYLAA